MKKNFDLKLIGRIIKEERKFKNLAQKDLASLFSINQSTISRIEKGENISLELYELILKLFDINLFGDEIFMMSLLNEIYIAIKSNNKNHVEKIYEHVITFDNLSINEHYLKLIIKGLYLVFNNKFTELDAYIPYLNRMKFVFEKPILKYYHLIRGYYFYYFRHYEKAINECNIILTNAYHDDFKDNFFNYLFINIQIHFKNYGIAQEILEKANELNKNNNIIINLHIKHLLAYIYFVDSNYQECIQLIENCEPANIEISFELNFLLAASLLVLEKYDDAYKYFVNIVETDLLIVKEKIHLYYAYLLYCLKLNDDKLYSYYYDKAKLESFYQNIKLRSIFEAIVLYEPELKNSVYYENINYLLLENCLIHVKLLYSISKTKNCYKKKCAFYMKIHELMNNKEMGCSFHDL